MTRLLRVFISAPVLLMIAGCGGATPYQKADDRGGLGYSDYRVRDNIYYVSVSGVPVKDKEVYRDYWNRRSKELCQGMGFQEYRVIEVKQDEGDPTPLQKAATPIDPRDSRYRATEAVRDFSRSASVTGKVECLKKK